MFYALLDDKADIPKFDAVYEKYNKLVYYFALEKLNDQMLAENATIDTFVDVAKHFKQVGEINSSRTKAYIMTIATTCIYNVYNKEKDHFVEDFNRDLVFNMEENEKMELWELVDRLPENYKLPLILNKKWGYKYKEIAQIMGISESLARKNTERAIAKLKESLGEDIDS